jgi:hypothetical protein
MGPLSSGPTARPEQPQAPLPSAPMAGKMADQLDDSPTPGQSRGQQGIKILLEKFSKMESDVTGMARQFPSAASASRQVIEGLRAMKRQIVANPGGQEPADPEGE